MKSFKEFLKEEFALPKYPAQTLIKFKKDDWVNFKITIIKEKQIRGGVYRT